MSEWQDINTAPKDKPFLAWQDSERGPFKCWWHVDHYDGEWWMDWQDSEPHPTHWMPLPSPPKAEAK